MAGWLVGWLAGKYIETPNHAWQIKMIAAVQKPREMGRL